MSLHWVPIAADWNWPLKAVVRQRHQASLASVGAETWRKRTKSNDQPERILSAASSHQIQQAVKANWDQHGSTRLGSGTGRCEKFSGQGAEIRASMHGDEATRGRGGRWGGSVEGSAVCAVQKKKSPVRRHA